MKDNKSQTLLEEISDQESEMIKGGIQFFIPPRLLRPLITTFNSPIFFPPSLRLFRL